jgi:hypothetical protein
VLESADWANIHVGVMDMMIFAQSGHHMHESMQPIMKKIE